MTGRLFSCIGHHLSEVWVAETSGLTLDSSDWSMESIRNRWQTVVNCTSALAPTSALDSMEFAHRCVGFESPGPGGRGCVC